MNDENRIDQIVQSLNSTKMGAVLIEMGILQDV